MYKENKSIKSFNYELETIKSSKLSFNRQDDKRKAHIDGIHTYARGHYKKKVNLTFISLKYLTNNVLLCFCELIEVDKDSF
jgi:hypothetical protein